MTESVDPKVFAYLRDLGQELDREAQDEAIIHGPRHVGDPPDDGGPPPLEAYPHESHASGHAAKELLPWPEPVNLFAELSAAPYQPAEIPVEIGDYARLYALQTGIDASLTLTSAVAAAAGALSDEIQVCADSGSRWFEQPRLWKLDIAAPGSAKTPAKNAMIEPLWKLHTELDAQWRKACDGCPEDEPKPARPRVIVEDATIEALSDVLTDNPRGILISCDEFDSWIGGMDQYRSGGTGNRDRGEWLRLFDGGPHSVERVKRGSVFVPNFSCSIITATTPAAMRRLAKHLPDDGLIQRFIIVHAQRQNLDSAGSISALELDEAHRRYTETLRRLYGLYRRAHNGVVPLSFPAKQRFDAWRRENLATQEAFASIAPALEAHLAKYPKFALRVALVFHCAKVVNFDHPESRDPAAWPVPLDTMEQALSFLRRASRHALAFYLSQRGASETYEIARSIARFVLSRSAEDNAEGVKRRELVHRVHEYRSADERVQGHTLRLLEDMGWLRPDVREGDYHKPQPTRFAINPSLHARFAEIAERERERRVIARALISESAENRREDRHEG